MSPMVSSSLRLERTIAKVLTTSSIFGRTLTCVRCHIPLQSPLMILCYLESVEEADNNEALELDDEQYPVLPENVLDLRLHQRKAILRQYMAAVRRTYSVLPILHCDQS